MNEHQLQQSIVDEADWRANQDFRWGLLLAIPNGQYRKGQRMEAGLRAGVPDLFLPVPRAATATDIAYHGLWIELKVGKNKPTDNQVDWAFKLCEQGYYYVWMHDDASKVIELIEWYLGGKP